MTLRQKCNDELFELYDSDLILRLRNAKNLSDTRTILAKFKQFLNQFPPSFEITKAFLAPFADRKPRTLYRYAHTLRHKFATDLLERGANLKVVQQLLGYENLATTEVYLSITDQSLRDVIGLLDSKAKKSALKKKIDPDKPAWVQAFDEMANDGKNYILGLDGTLYEV